MTTSLEREVQVGEVQVGEIFIIKNNTIKMPRPILADVKRVEVANDWQRVFISALPKPHNGYEINTSRRSEDGVYHDRSNRYNYLRMGTVGVHRLEDFFDGWKKGELALELFKEVCKATGSEGLFLYHRLAADFLTGKELKI